MQLSSREAEALGEIVGALSDEAPELVLRQVVGRGLMRLLHADHLASYVWDGATSSYGLGVAVNMAPDNLLRYEQHFQFRDPVTPRMSGFHHATLVDQVIDSAELQRTEFYSDFLARDGLHHGLNFFARSGGRRLGDIRLWRTRNRAAFTENERAMLELVGQVLSARLAEVARAESTTVLAGRLTPREREIAAALKAGLSDAAIARRLVLSPATVRSHVNHVFQKLEVRSRLEAVAVLNAELNSFDDGVPSIER